MRCEHCEAETETTDWRVNGVKLALCRVCRHIDIIGRWRREFYGEAA
jgi:hypothetical protein